MNGGRFCCCNHLFFCCLRTNVEQIISDGSMEEIGFLRDDTNKIPKRLQGYLFHIIAINLYCPFINVVETRDKIGDGGFACSAWSNEGYQLSWLDRKREITQHPMRSSFLRCNTLYLSLLVSMILPKLFYQGWMYGSTQMLLLIVGK